MKKNPSVNGRTETKADKKRSVKLPSPVSSALRKTIFAIVLVVTVFGASFYSVKNNRQFEMMGGMCEEYLDLGVNMFYSGRFYLADSSQTPFVFRPPGYVKYLDIVLTAYGKMKPKGYQFRSQEEFDQEKAKVLNAIYFSQCILVTVSSLILFLLLSEFSGLLLAFCISFMFGINPYLDILAGMVHYETLHIFFILLSTWLMYLGFARNKYGLIFLLLSGISWGLTTLVRPLSLILPVIFACMLLFYFRKNWRSSLLYFSIFAISFVCTIAPYTYRNYKLTHRLIPVNAQSNISLWAGSHTSLDFDANHYRWWQIWYPDGQKVYEEITGTKGFQTTIYADHVFEFEDYFGIKFRENVSSQPMTYLGNVCKNFLLLNFGMNSVFIKIFQYKQHNSGEINKDWFQKGNVQNFYPSDATDSFSFLIMILSVLSLAGIFLSIKKNDRLIYIPLVAFLTIVIAHSITYMDLMYYYVRIPFLFIFTAFFIRHLDSLFKGPNAVIAQRITVFGLTLYMIFLYMAVIA